LSLALTLARRLLGLPPRRHRCELETRWVALPDGVRLATSLLRPRTPPGEKLPAVLVRTAAPAHAAGHPTLLLARLLAEDGHLVAVQECRGRHASEGRFEPFAREVEDGAAAVSWLAAQPGCDGRVALVGAGYAGHAAWAAASRSPVPIAALVVAFAARDPWAELRPGGAFALASALRLAVGLGEREAVPERRLDLARALAFRPVREADRVALRRVDCFRAWADHAERDALWRSLEAPLPPEAPPALLVAGWHHPALGAQLADYAALAGAAERGRGAAPELVVGPWPGGGARARRAPGALATALREALAFLERRLRGGGGGTPAPVRLFLHGARGWRAERSWPPAGARECRLYLRGAGRAGGLAGDGRLAEGAPGDSEPADRFRYDPADPVPSRGGVRGGRGGGPADQREVESRPDVLCYTSDPFAEPLALAGPVRSVLFASSSAPATDFTAKLVAVHPDGRALHLCDGIARCRLAEGAAQRVEVDLVAAGAQLPAGARLRLEVSSSNFPRFSRHCNADRSPEAAEEEAFVPAQQTLRHDAQHPSCAIVSLLPGGAGP
jgi:hypothetical protein